MTVSNLFNYILNRSCLEKHEELCLENKLCVMKFPRDLFALRDFHQKVPFYFLGIADSEWMNEIYLTENYWKKDNSYSWTNCCQQGLTIVSELESLLNTSC